MSGLLEGNHSIRTAECLCLDEGKGFMREPGGHLLVRERLSASRPSKRLHCTARAGETVLLLTPRKAFEHAERPRERTGLLVQRKRLASS